MDAVGASMVSVCGLSADDVVGRPPSARRCTAGGAAIDESLAGSAEDVALSWTDGAVGTIGACARGKSSRGSSLASIDSAGGAPSVEVLASFTPEERSIGTLPLRGRSVGTRCATMSIDIRSPGEASIGARVAVEASIDSLAISGTVVTGLAASGIESLAARCTP